MRNFTLISLAASITIVLTGCLDGGGDVTVTSLPDLKPSISGKAILSSTGEGLADAKVRLRIGGEWREISTIGGDNYKTGDFLFKDVPAYASFFIEIDPKEDDYATTYTFGTTVTTDGGQGINDDEFAYDLTKDIGNVVVYGAAPTNITVMDIDTGTAITGLGMWMEPAGYSTGNAKGGTIAAPFIQPEETTGIYTFTMPNNGSSIGVYVNSLVDENGVIYQTLAGDLLNAGNLDGECAAGTGGLAGPSGTNVITACESGGHDDSKFKDHTLTMLAPGVDSTIYLRQYTASNLTVNFELIDDNGQAYNAGMAIDVQEVSSGQVFSAAQDASQTNLYSISIPYQRDLSFVIASMDIDGDSFKDTSTALVYGTVNRQPNQTEVTLAVQIDELTDNTAISATVVSDTLVPGQLAEAVIVFNQPVVLTGTNAAQARFETLNNSAAADAGDRVAPDATILDSAGNAGPILTLTAQASPNANKYDYTDKATNPAEFTLAGAQGSDGTIVYPFERRVDLVETIVAATATASGSSNTIYRVALDANTIDDLQEVSFSLTVRSEVSGEIERITTSHRTDTTETFAGLSDLVLDNGDFIDDTTRSAITNNPTPHVTENEELAYNIANSDTLGTCSVTAGGLCQFRAAAKPADVTHGTENTLALISPVAFYGSIKLVSYVNERQNTSGNAEQYTTNVYDNAIFVYHETGELAELDTGAGNVYCATGDASCKEQGSYYYFLADPANQDLDDKNGASINSAFGTNVADWARGYARSTGLGFLVPMGDLNITTPGGELLKSATLDIDIMVDGVRYKDTVTLTLN